ncbi:MAG TPA: choice-of-anchor P family protein [Acidimicrobiales bacterium]|nr:choice-of-anchor P family protein [Acidimicrobiales bacterium]
MAQPADRRRTRRARRRWTGVATLGLLLATLGLGGARSPVEAQVASGADLFGGFNLTGRANGIQVSYNVENVFPLPPPLLQITVPEALSTSQSGPASTALGSAAFPGNVLGNLPAIAEQASPGNGQFIPPYPLATRADYPAGPFEAGQDVGTASASVAAGELGSQAVSTLSASSIPGVIEFGTVTTSATTGIEGDQVVARSRSEIGEIRLLFGLITLTGVVTDLVATSNGETAEAVGTTTVGGAALLGLPLTISPDGLVLGEVTDPGAGTPAAPLTEQLTGALGQLGTGLAPVVEGLDTAVDQLLGGVGSLNDLLAAAGIEIRVLEPIVTVDGAQASITGNGVFVDIVYDGSGDNPLAQLLSLIPADQLPGEGIPGFPLNTSPQALVGLLKETHVQSVALAYGTASVVASPAFSFTATPPVRPSGGSSGATGTAGTPGTPGRPATPGFSTPTPNLPAPGGTQPIAGEGGGGIGGSAVGAFAVVLALLASPVWAFGSGRLADNVLQATSSACPQGLDRPLPTGGT